MRLALASSVPVPAATSVALGAVRSAAPQIVPVAEVLSVGLGAVSLLFAPVVMASVGLGAVRNAACSP